MGWDWQSKLAQNVFVLFPSTFSLSSLSSWPLRSLYISQARCFAYYYSLNVHFWTLPTAIYFPIYNEGLYFWCHKVCHKVFDTVTKRRFWQCQKLCDTLCDTRNMDPKSSTNVQYLNWIWSPLIEIVKKVCMRNLQSLGVGWSKNRPTANIKANKGWCKKSGLASEALTRVLEQLEQNGSVDSSYNLQ